MDDEHFKEGRKHYLVSQDVHGEGQFGLGYSFVEVFLPILAELLNVFLHGREEPFHVADVLLSAPCIASLGEWYSLFENTTCGVAGVGGYVCPDCIGIYVDCELRSQKLANLRFKIFLDRLVFIADCISH